MESPRHRNSVFRVKQLLLGMEATILQNDWSRGDGGYVLPPITTAEGIKEYILDVYARLKTGTMMDFEVDYKYKNSRKAVAKMEMRDELLMRHFNIRTVRGNPKDVDEWVKNPALFEKEIRYRMKAIAQ